MPAQRPCEVAAVERSAELAGEHVIVSESARGVEPRVELFEDRNLARLAALCRPFDEATVTIRREGSTDRQDALALVEVVPSKADQFAEPQAGEGQASERPLSRRMETRECEHPTHLKVVEGAGGPFGIVRLPA